MNKINEIFYSLQGEGYNTGAPAVFVRFCGCNLKCDFCDTKHNTGKMLTDEEIVNTIKKSSENAQGLPLIVFTGGEPTLRSLNGLIDLLHEHGYKIAIETNGTNNPDWLQKIDFITISPKFEFCPNADVVITKCNELKIVYNGSNDLTKYNHIKADHYYLQPCDTGNREQNREIINSVIEECKNNPKWCISLQTQKILGVL